MRRELEPGWRWEGNSGRAFAILGIKGCFHSKKGERSLSLSSPELTERVKRGGRLGNK